MIKGSNQIHFQPALCLTLSPAALVMRIKGRIGVEPAWGKALNGF
jgi:hypothetical protein